MNPRKPRTFFHRRSETPYRRLNVVQPSIEHLETRSVMSGLLPTTTAPPTLEGLGTDWSSSLIVHGSMPIATDRLASSSATESSSVAIPWEVTNEDTSPTAPGGVLVEPAANPRSDGPKGNPSAWATYPAPEASMQHEVVFIDSRVADPGLLINDLKTPRDGVDYQVFMLDPNQDGVAQISAVLAGLHGINAIHIVSHGEDGAILIGNTLLSAAALDSGPDRSEIASWSSALAPGADLMLYGCDVAHDPEGKAFVRELGNLTGAAVAANTGLTGLGSLGGTWTLGYDTGQIDTSVAFDQRVQQYWAGLLTISVNNTDSATTSSAGASSLTFSHSVFTGTDSILLVEVVVRQNAQNQHVTSITYNGVNLTSLGSANAPGSEDAEIWYLLSPTVAVGISGVVVNLSGSAPFAASATTFYGVNQSNPTNLFSAITSTTGSPYSIVSYTPGELVVDAVATQGNAQSLAPGIGQTQLWNNATGTSANDSLGGGSYGGSIQISGGSGLQNDLMYWTLGVNQPWALATVALNPAVVNQAPVGTNKTVTTLENTPYVFAVSDFGFTDPNTPPSNFLAAKITTLPSAGTLTDNGTAVTAGQFVPVTDITSGLLRFTPAANATGASYSSFTFQVQNDGGTANGGVDTDPSPKTMSVSVTAVNQPPIGANNTVTTLENTPYTFAESDFGFSDPNNPANSFLAVEITTPPGAGALTDNGLALSAGQFVPVTDIAAGKLKFTPTTNTNGSGYSSFTFQVQNNGGTANGGVDTDPSPKTMALNVTAVNQTPVGTSNTVTTMSGQTYIISSADFGFNDPNDIPPNSLQAVEITTLPGAGTLTDGGAAVTAGQFIPLSDLIIGKLTFTPAAFGNGTNYASFTFQVQDDGGTANGGVDTDPIPKTMTVNVTWVNNAPSGTSKTVSTPENTPYVFTGSDFGFSDPNDNPPNNLKSVKITTLPAAGTFTDNGSAVTAGQFVSVSDINAGLLVFTPGNNVTGANYAGFTFQVQDDGGTANGGTDTDPSPKIMSINVTSMNHAPIGTSSTVTTPENTPYTFAASDFGFNDPNDSPPNNFLSVEISSLPSTGTLTDNGTAVTIGQFIAVSDINAGLLKFTPAPMSYLAPHASFTFQVRDDGGIANGGVDTDPSPKTMVVNVMFVNHAPIGTINTVTTSENSPYKFSTSDFGFSDPNDNPSNNFLAVEISTLPSSGTLTLNGVAVTVGEFVTVADINAGLFSFMPAIGAYGAGYASFNFQVQDDGGTANGGADLDPSWRTMALNVTEVNHSPVGASKTVTTTENIPYTFSASDFGFSDPNDNPSNNFLAVEISSLPGAGTLTDNGLPVTVGQFVPVTDLNAGKLKFTPASNAYGTNYASFDFQVRDDGGTANGGADTDSTPKAMTVDVVSVNHAPAGNNNTLTTLENSAYVISVADFGFGDLNDIPPNNFLAVEISTLPSTGTLTNNGIPVVVGQFVPVSDINAGVFRFTPALNGTGTSYASFNFQVQDDGGTANGGVDTDPSWKTITLNVTSVNQPPTGTSKTVSTLENTPYTFAVSDFGFTDPNNPPNSFLAVEFTTLPGAGTLTNNGVAVTAGQFVLVSDITSGFLKFTPSVNTNGANYANFTFQVQNNGGTANGGVDTDPSPKTMTLNVTSVNQAPTGTSKTVSTLENNSYAFAVLDFGFTDLNSPPNGFLAVKITTLPGSGTLTDNGIAITAGQFVPVTDITSGLLRFTPSANTNGANYANFTFQVQNNGGTANGGVDTDASPKTMTLDVTSVNQPPAGTSKTVSTLENTPYTLTVSDFGFSDPNIPSNIFLAVEITTQPGAGTLTNNGVTVTAGQFVSVTDIASGLLKFTPTANTNGANYASFTFQVQNNGGTGNGGVDTDPSPKTMTLNVRAVNQPPKGTSKTVSTLENTPYTFAVSDFGFTDPNSPPNSFLAVGITTLPGAGTLTDNGVVVTFGQFVSLSDIASGFLKFTPSANTNGANYASFTFQVQNNGGTANGGVDTDPSPKTMALNVIAVNQPPSVLVPSLQSDPMNTPVLFSSRRGNPIVIHDLDAGNYDLQVTLSTNAGSMILGSVVGLVFQSGTQGSMVFSFTGSLANLNTALDGLVYSPPFGFVGTAWLQVQVNDLGHSGVGGPKIDTELIPIHVFSTPPRIIGSPVFTLGPLVESVPSRENLGTTVPAILASAGPNAIVDSDIGAVQGLALVGADVSSGLWQYSTNGGLSWSTLGKVSETSATVLTSTSNDLIRFLPSQGFHGKASIQIKAWDTTDGRASGSTFVDLGSQSSLSAYSAESAMVTISVVHLPPVASPHQYEISAGINLSVDAPGLLADASDPAAYSLTLEIVVQPAHGFLSFSSDGAFLYIPEQGWSGRDSFQYQANDGVSQSQPELVSIVVNPSANIPPVAPNGPQPVVFITPPNLGSPGTTQSSGSRDSGNSSSTVPSNAGPVRAPETIQGAATTHTATSRWGSDSSGKGRGHGSTKAEADTSGDESEEEGDQDEKGEVGASNNTLANGLTRARNQLLGVLDATMGFSGFRPSRSDDSDAESGSMTSRAGFDYSHVIAQDSTEFLKELNQMGERLSRPGENEVVTAAVVSGLSISVGYLVWTIRANYLIAALLTGSSIWREIDPLAVLDDVKKKGKEASRHQEADDSLLRIVQHPKPHIKRVARSPHHRGRRSNSRKLS